MATTYLLYLSLSFSIAMSLQNTPFAQTVTATVVTTILPFYSALSAVLAIGGISVCLPVSLSAN